MGITIHYKGKIDSRDLIPKLIEDCRDFADSMGWQYVVLDNEKDILHRGIVLTVHPEAESLNLTFGEDGSLRSFIDCEERQLFVKTQFSGIDAHISIVKLLKYLKKHYISNLEVCDEGEYWESGNIDILSQKSAFLQSKIDMLSSAFAKAELTKDESMDIFKLADKVEQILRETFENKDG